MGSLGVAVLLIAIVLRGIAISIMWTWFVVPLGVPSIGVAHAIGFSAIAAALTRDHPEDKRSTRQVLILAFAKPIALVAIGWIITQFM